MTINLRPKLVGLAARRAEAEAELALTAKAPIKYLPASEASERIGIVFDDSISMSPENNANARAGVEEFLRSCKPNQTAVAVYPMNGTKYDLTTDLPALAILVDSIRSSGGTPMFQTAFALTQKPVTRIIIFSDGEPTDRGAKKEFVDNLKRVEARREIKIPVDTVFIGRKDSPGYFTMQNLAEELGGIFLHFSTETANFRTAFKYLAPVNRHMLADKSFVAKLEGR